MLSRTTALAIQPFRRFTAPWLSGERLACTAALPCGGVSSSMAPLTVPLRLCAAGEEVRPEKRQSRRRYTADNTRGRVSRAKDLIDEMKVKSSTDAKAMFDSLMPRDKLDVVRLLHAKRTKRRRDRRRNGLPRYRSSLFERRYYFREEDVTEQSTLGRGPGGQATNRRMQTVILTHLPTGLIVKFSRFPSLWLNRRAARELLNLRLEERLLGEDSELGRARARKERQRRRNLKQRERLSVKGAVLAARDTQQRAFYEILVGRAPFPAQVAEQLGLTERQHPLKVTDLFDAECEHWWPLLQHAFTQCGAPSKLPTEGPEGSEQAPVPLLLTFLFPVAAPASTPAGRYEQAQVARCRGDECALANVRRAYRCFCEVFGLRLVEGHSPSGARRLALMKDGLNWREMGCRLLTSDGQAAAPQLCRAWEHVYTSLEALGLKEEARSARSFFTRECRQANEGKDSRTECWATAFLSALKK